MEYLIFLYVFFAGCVYASWLWDPEDHFIVQFMWVCYGLVNGWIATPILIGRAIKQIYKD